MTGGVENQSLIYREGLDASRRLRRNDWPSRGQVESSRIQKSVWAYTSYLPGRKEAIVTSSDEEGLVWKGFICEGKCTADVGILRWWGGARNEVVVLGPSYC